MSIKKKWCTQQNIIKSLKKEGNPVKTWMILEDIIISEISQKEEEKSLIYVKSKQKKLVKIIETESKKMLSKGAGGVE